jgi:glycosyltransferase involved in cell wall biosynthesis
MPPASPTHAPVRLAVVVSHPIQYYAPWFRHLAAAGDLQLRVFYLSDHGLKPRHDVHFRTAFAWDTDLLSGYAHEFVPNRARHPDVTRFAGLRNPGLHRALIGFSPDAILLFGYAHRTHLQLILRPPAPLVFRGDSHLLGQAQTRWLKRILLRFLCRRFAAVTYVGQANRDYFRAFGVPERKLFFAPHAVDAVHFSPTPANTAQAAALRARLNLDAMTVVLFAGKLVPAKQPRELLQAFIDLAPADAALVFIGEGAEKPALQQLAARHPACTVHFLPFANQSEMPARLLLADIFALPSRGHYETWGLAVNEAMHLGVPCLVSDRVGCQRDLVTDGETGWVFAAEDLSALRQKLAQALREVRPRREPLRANIARRMAGYTYAQTTAGLHRALQSITA